MRKERGESIEIASQKLRHVQRSADFAFRCEKGNGPLIRRSDAPADFDRALYNSVRRRDIQLAPCVEDRVSSDMEH